MHVNGTRCLRWLEGRISIAYQLQFPIALFVADIPFSHIYSHEHWMKRASDDNMRDPISRWAVYPCIL